MKSFRLLDQPRERIRLLYGTGMRITEGLQLRGKDVDFAHPALMVREGKGGKDRVVMLPDALVAELHDQPGAHQSRTTAFVEQREHRPDGLAFTHFLAARGPSASSDQPARLGYRR